MTTKMEFVPPLSNENDPLDPFNPSYLCDGVQGYAIANQGEVWIPWIAADVEGDGRVGKLLDNLAEHCCIVNITSKRLLGMLLRRGWKPRQVDTPDGPVDVWRLNK